MPIYVAGPVIRPGTRQRSWIAECYHIIDELVQSNPRFRARLPLAEAALDHMNPDEFAGEIIDRIRAADIVIALFLPDDQSVPVECALASKAGKRTLLLHQPGAKIPRILAGLPGLTASPHGPTTRQRIHLFLLS